MGRAGKNYLPELGRGAQDMVCEDTLIILTL